MAETDFKTLAAHLSCLLTSAQATLTDIQAAEASGRPVTAITRGLPYRTLLSDVIEVNGFLQQMAQSLPDGREIRAAGDLRTLFPTAGFGLPDRSAR